MPTDALETLLALASANAIATRSLEAHGLSFSEIRLLLALRASETGRRPGDVAQELHLTPSGVTRAFLPLEKRGIVRREKDPTDARASKISLTPAGMEALDDALAVAAERAARLLRRLSVGQSKQLERLLNEIAPR